MVQMVALDRTAQIPFPYGSVTHPKDPLALLLGELRRVSHQILQAGESLGIARASIGVLATELQRAGPHFELTTSLGIHTTNLPFSGPSDGRAPDSGWITQGPERFRDSFRRRR